MSGFNAAAREARLRADYTESTMISDKAYNGIMGATVLYGIIVNVIICGLVGNTYAYINPLVFLIGYFVCAFAGIFIANKSKNPAISFLGYNLVVIPLGLMISTMVYAYGGISSLVVIEAFFYTMMITIVMVAMSILFPQFFSKIGGFLFAGLLGIVITEVVLMLFHIPQIATSWMAAILFSLYIGYDFYRSQQFAKTVDNAVDCALDIYLDIANLFVRLLQILGRRK
ncbi:MAG: Bax inhibitor-1 family protein [Eubacteriales bacterium]|nr:Bax inhibitor-1 family protein [Eubacteriales bacterium]